MSLPPSNSSAPSGTSTRPYLIRALHDWCTDNGFTPYLAVSVDDRVDVPREHVKNNEIVLNVGFEATSGLKLGNEFIEFRARFSGQAREICIPVTHVIAIYARENGQGMAFPAPEPTLASHASAGGGASHPPGAAKLSAVEAPQDDAPQPSDGGDTPTPSPVGRGAKRPALKRVK
jgi:stringent starvation protein B